MQRRYEAFTAEELRQAGNELAAVVAVIPIAAIEQHGPHLPLGTDALISDRMVETVMARLDAALPATFLPTLRIGKSPEHQRFAGTLSHSWETATRGLIEIGEGLLRTGFRRLVIVSAHGGNTPVMETAALELRAKGGFCATASWQRFGVPEGLLPPEEIATGIHGGAVETALMLHFAPDLVRRERIAAFASLQSEMEAGARHLRAHGRLGFGWLAGDLNPAGVVGDARLATAAIGRAIAEHQAARFAEFLEDVAGFDLDRLD